MLFETALFSVFLIVVISVNRVWDFIMQIVLLVFLAVRVSRVSGCYCGRSNGPLSALGHLSSLSGFNEFRAINEKLFRSGLKERGSYFPTSKYVIFVFSLSLKVHVVRALTRSSCFRKVSPIVLCGVMEGRRLLQTGRVDSVKLGGVPVS